MYHSIILKNLEHFPNISIRFVAAPPSYSECVFGKTNIREEDDSEHTRGEMDYAPAYTYYDWSKQSQFQ